MIKTEYKQLVLKITDFLSFVGDFKEEDTKKLNELGKDGWELVQSVPIARAFGRTDKILFIFKRDI